MKEWHCVLFGQPQGPFSEDQLREMVRAGEVSAATPVRRGSPDEGEGCWLMAAYTEAAALLPAHGGGGEWDQHGIASERAAALYIDERFRRLAAEQGVLLHEGWQFKASRRRRLAAFVLGLVILLAFSLVFLAPPLLILRGEPTRTALYVFLAAFAAFAAYGVTNFCLLARRGQSVSKNLAGIRIVNADGSRTPLWKILALRNGVYAVLITATAAAEAARQACSAIWSCRCPICLCSL